MTNIVFNTPEVLPFEDGIGHQFLVINHDNDYLVATAFLMSLAVFYVS